MTPKENNFLSGSQGKALLFDLDKKFEEQDRMIKYLLTQIGQIEDQQQSYKELNAKMRDIDADNVSKLENSFKKNNEVSGFQLQELTQKMRSLESQIEIAE